jgi:hypothetical protein
MYMLYINDPKLEKADEDKNLQFIALCTKV